MVIPNVSGIHAAKEALDEFRSNPKIKPSKDSLIQLLEFVLTQNNFKFNRQHYLQVGSTSMSTKAAPSYVNTFTGKFEDVFVTPLWKRYIDDCFFIWTCTEDSLSNLIT